MYGFKGSTKLTYSAKARIGVKILLAVLSILIISNSVSAPPTVIYVPDDYDSIQSAISNATSGSTIIVRDGTYTENINVDTSLIIKSENGSDNCIIQASHRNDHVFEITANNTTISEFTLKGATGDKRAGVYLFEVYDAVITKNYITNNNYGVFCLNSNNSTILDNEVISNDHDGIEIENSHNNTITDNKACRNKWMGINLSHLWVGGHNLFR